MTIKAIVETTEGLPEPLQELYEPLEEGKGFRLKVEPVGGFSLEDVSGLKSALGKERGEAEKWKRAAEKYGDLDPGAAREAMEKLAELEKIDPNKEADKIAAAKIEAVTKQLVGKHGDEVKSRDETITQLRRKVETLLIDQAAVTALSEARGSVKLLLPHVRTRTRIVERDGDYRVEVLQDDGKTPLFNGKGDPGSIADLIAEMRASDEFARAFEASGKSGAGMAQTNGTGGGAATLKRGQMSAKQKAEYLSEHGQDAYLRLPR